MVSSDYFSTGISLNSLWRSSNSSIFSRSDFDYSRVNGTTDTVLHFKIQFWDDVELESSILFQIFFGWLINDISNCESFDWFIFRASSSAVYANNASDVTSVVFISTVVSSLLRHLYFVVIKIKNYLFIKKIKSICL